MLRTIWLSTGERAGWLKNTIKVELARSAHPGGINERTYSFYLTHLFSLHFLFIEISVLSLLQRKSSLFSLPSYSYWLTCMLWLLISFQSTVLKIKTIKSCLLIYSFSLSVPGTSSHGASPPDSLWPSGSGRVRSRQQASPGSGPRRRGSWAWLWALREMEAEREREREGREVKRSIFLLHTLMW